MTKPRLFDPFAKQSRFLQSLQPKTTTVGEQEDAFLDAPWDGTLADGLTKSRTEHRTKIADLLKQSRDQSQGLLDTTLTDLTGGRDRYRTGMGDLISRLTSSLQGGREGYRTRSQAAIDADRAARDAEFLDYENAERMGANQAIAQGTRANKALFAKTGAGASSYADRLAAGLRMGAETRLAQNLANRRAINRDALRAQQLALDNSLFNVERDDLGRIYGDETRLLDTLAGQERADEAFQFGAQGDIYNRDFAGQMALENQDFNLGRDDDRFVYGERTRTVGRRNPYIPKPLTNNTTPAPLIRPVAGGRRFRYGNPTV